MQLEDGLNILNEYSRTNAEDVYPHKRKQKRGAKRIAVYVLIAFLSVLVVALLALAAYGFVLQSRLSNNGEIKRELAPVLNERKAPQDPFYMLLLGTDGRSWDTLYRTDTILLCRIDPGHKKVTLISIPRDTPIKLEGHGTQKINAAYEFGGPKRTIEEVSKFAGVPITHYMQVDFNGFKDIVDAIGGVHINVPVHIEDWKAGPSVIEPGPQVLNGEEALTFARSRRFKDGDFSRMRHQRMFISALADEIVNNMNPARLVSTLDSVSNMVVTDMSLAEIIGLITQYRGFDPEKDVYSANVPSDAQMIGNVSYVVPDLPAWQAMMEKVKLGEDPSTESPEYTAELTKRVNELRSKQIIAYNPENREYSVRIENATKIGGAASTARTVIRDGGFVISTYTDAKSKDLEKTIIYYKPGARNAAQKISKGFSLGKVELKPDTIEFNSDILVRIGSDWADVEAIAQDIEEY
ncbi:MAG: LCP family protein [Coriobacteriia bacterium]|nr:LCP family protein [Coriobacteriia bacterium]